MPGFLEAQSSFHVESFLHQAYLNSYKPQILPLDFSDLQHPRLNEVVLHVLPIVLYYSLLYHL